MFWTSLAMRRISFIVALILLLQTYTSTQTTNKTAIEAQWESYKIKFKKAYKSSDEEAKRFAIFKENCAWFEKHNKNHYAFNVGVNRDADLSSEEIAKKFTENPLWVNKIESFIKEK